MLSYGEFWAFPARQAAEQLLSRSELPDAVICANDIMAINVCDVFAKNGVDVPSQVIVTGFDGIPETSFVRPEISTVLCDNSAMADDAADVLISLMNGGSVGKVLAHPKLMPNASCGCEKKDIRAVVNGMNESFYRYQDDVRLLYDITVRMQMSRTSADAAGVLKYQNEHNHKPLIHDFCCIADRNCLDRKQNYFDSEQVSLADSEKVVICDSFSDRTGIYPLDDVLIPIIEIFKSSDDAEEFINSLGINKLPFRENDKVYTPKGEDTISCLSIDFDRRKLLIHTEKNYTFTMEEWGDTVSFDPTETE